MLSGLPDDVLRHILSFLPTKTSVSTSVLAKRWRFLWAHVPNLEFYEHDFRGGSEAQPLDIINSVTMLHEAKTVNTFSFRLYNVKVCAIQLETLINFFIERSVKNLSLEFYYKFWRDIVFIVPSLLFTCKTLVDLKLVKCGVIPSSGDFFLPSLKKLNLWYVEYESDESLPNLLSGCPLLEELSIHDDFSMGVKGQKYSGRIIVSSLTIKILIVDFSLGYIDREDMLIIDVPALIYLKVNRCHLDWVKCLSKTMACLIEADIFLNGDLHTSAILEFRSILCQARQLKISNVHGEMVNNIKGTGSMMKFVNLIKLELNMTVDWYVLAELLESSDNLEVLNFRLGGCFRYKEPERVPLFLLSRLRNVHVIVNNCLSYEVVFDTVRYILRNARVLERMKISHLRSRFSGTEKLDVLQRISLFERVSKSCQVSFNTAMEYDA